MEGDKHFSHDHPLTFFINKEVDDYEHEKPNYLCNICGLPILSIPSYTCSSCKFFLHKPCAEMPKELNHPRHDPDLLTGHHSLHLKPKSPCDQNYFTYKCEGCMFELHPLVAASVEIKTNHISHQSHPLVLICRETLSECDACGEEQKGFFFCCQKCNFWIHQECTILPNVVRLPSHPNPFILTYSLPSFILKIRRCIICNKKRHLAYRGVYFCGEGTHLVAHVSCAKSSIKTHENEITRLELIQLPDEGDTFPSLAIRRFVEKNSLIQNDDDDDDDDDDEEEEEEEEEYHKHPLIFDDGVSSSSSGREASCNVVCEVRTQPIKTPSPFYRCGDCHFLAHDICVNLLRIVKQHSKINICPDPSNLVFNSVFPCFFCHRPCNGLCYYSGSSLEFPFMDPECLHLPFTIKHASHRQHVLFQAQLGPSNISNAVSCCSGESFFFDIYRCVLCDFNIHIRCALLPKRTQHKFDEHPLVLIMTPHQNKYSINEEQKCCLCEFCKKDINRKHWYYGCGECGQYFHINCIPPVGYLSKVKFRKNLVDDNIHPHHPLTLTRMLTHGRHESCGHCNQIIQGFADEMTFNFSRCDFWIHFSCARGSSTTPRLKLYSEIEEEFKENFEADYVGF